VTLGSILNLEEKKKRKEDRKIDYNKRIRGPEIDPQIQTQLIFS
jgi:hypothetical protein